MDAFDAQLTRLNTDEEFRKAMNNIRNLALDGAKADRREEAIRVYAYLAVRHEQRDSRRTPKEHWEVTWAHDTGKSWKALTEFPDRLRKVSAEVRGVHGSAYFNPERAIRGGLADWADFSGRVFSGENDEFVDFVKKQFSLLPATLDRYAQWLEVQVKGINALMKHFYLSTPRKHSLFIDKVSDEVKQITGQFHDRQVADLLNAADRVVHPGGSDYRFYEQGIALLRSRRKRKSSRT